MPTWTISTTTTSGYVWEEPSSPTQQWEEWQQECERQDRIMEAQMREAAEQAEDRKKYPLFFLKDGIV